MSVVGFSFNKIHVEKKEGVKGKISISNNVSVTDVKETTLPVGTEKPTALKFYFEFSSKYDPKLGEVKLGGELMYLQDSAKVKEIMTMWNKDKKLPKEVMSPILNTILSKSNILALILSQEVSLPPPIPLPKLKSDQEA